MDEVLMSHEKSAGGLASFGFGAHRLQGSQQVIVNNSLTRFQPTTLVDPNTMIATGASWRATLPAGADGYWDVTLNLAVTLTGATWTPDDYLVFTLFAGAEQQQQYIVGHTYAEAIGSDLPMIINVTVRVPFAALVATNQIYATILNVNAGTLPINVQGWIGAHRVGT